jgi:hypothetical protein
MTDYKWINFGLILLPLEKIICGYAKNIPECSVLVKLCYSA